jgi:hypothetical protein
MAKSRERAEETSTNLSRLNPCSKTVNRFLDPSLKTRFLLPALFGSDTASLDFSEQVR